MKTLVKVLLVVCLIMTAYGSAQAFRVYDKVGNYLGIYVADDRIYLPAFHRILFMNYDYHDSEYGNVRRVTFHYQTTDCTGTSYVDNNYADYIFKDVSGDTLYTGLRNTAPYSIVAPASHRLKENGVCVQWDFAGSYQLVPTEIFKGKIPFPLPIEYPTSFH